MKLTVVLVAVLGYSALLLTNAAQQKTGKAATPKASPTATPVKQQTPRASPTASPAPTAQVTPTATTATPAKSPTPTTTVTPHAPSTPAPTAATTPTPATSPAPGAKDPCEGKKLPNGIPLCDRTQPDVVNLSKDALQSRSHEPAPPKTPAELVRFTHTAHAKEKYSVDGKSVIGCAECHHTDQPADKLTSPLKTSLRSAMLTAELLTASAPPVLSCRACHAQKGKKPPVCDDAQMAARYTFCPNIPTASYEDEGDVVQDNEEAYHRNCKKCHEDAVIARGRPGGVPFIKAKPPTGCTECHKAS
jgi:Zn-finger protein